MIELTISQLAGICVFLLLLGGTIAVYGIRFLEWTDHRRADRRFREVETPDAVHIPTPRKPYRFVADTSDFDEKMRDASASLADIDLIRPHTYTQRRADAIREEHLARRRETSRRLGDPPPPGMEDHIVERLTELGEDLRAADPQLSSNTTDEETN